MSAGPALERRLGLFETTLAGVGIILGAGIYALIGEAAETAGNAAWISFVVAAVVASLTGLSYAELASAYPRAAADYEFARRGLGARAGFVVGWLMVVSNLVGGAAVALGFGGYLATFLDVDRTILASAALVVSTVIAFVGVREAVLVSIILTFVEAAGLVFVIAIGLPHLGERDLTAGAGFFEILSGAALVTFAFVGFSQVAALAEETVDAPRVIPRAMLLSIAVTATLYVLVAVAAVSAVGAETLAGSDAPLATVGAEFLGGRSGDVVAVIALFSTANTILLFLMAASRMIYGMASGEEAALPRFIGWIHPGVNTPARAILVCLVVSLGFTLSGDIRFVAEASNVAVFIVFGAINVTLIVLRYRARAHPRSFRVPFSYGRLPIPPVLGAVASLALLASIDIPPLLAGGALLVLGIVVSQLLRLWHPAGQ